MLRTQMMIDEKTKRELERAAEAEKVSMGKLARKFIRQGLENRKGKMKKSKKRTLGEFILRLSENAGRSRGKGDLSIRHDYYLYGEGRIK